MDVPIIFEDDSFLVINKPFGVVVNRAETTRTETVQDWAEVKVHSSQFAVHSEIDKEFVNRGGIVHRLDKDTSGLLVIAKDPATFEKLKNQFKDRSTVKKYLTLVHGKVEPPAGKINAPIERSPFNRMHYGVFPGGREAETDYRVISNFQFPIFNEKLSLLEVTPHTGRTHQIRVHLKYINHPIVSDPIYGGRKNYQNDLKFCPRLFLHAAHLEINDPQTGGRKVFDAPLPSDLQMVLDQLN